MVWAGLIGIRLFRGIRRAFSIVTDLASQDAVMKTLREKKPVVTAGIVLFSGAGLKDLLHCLCMLDLTLAPSSTDS